MATNMTLRNCRESDITRSRWVPAPAIGLIVGVLVLVLPGDARASLLSPELEDKLATFLALFVIFVVPAVLIALFWMVHILPEKIAHQRHHPQFEAIRTLCLLSLVFGGLLWPIAWIWAYSKPVLHKMAYGTDQLHPDPQPVLEGSHQELHQRLARLEAHGLPDADLKTIRADVEALEARYVEHGRGAA